MSGFLTLVRRSLRICCYLNTQIVCVDFSQLTGSGNGSSSCQSIASNENDFCGRLLDPTPHHSVVMPLTTIQRFSLNSFGVAPSNDFRGILNSSFQAMPFEGMLYSSLRAAPFKGIPNSSFRAVPFKGILYSSLQAAPFKGITKLFPSYAF